MHAPTFPVTPLRVPSCVFSFGFGLSHMGNGRLTLAFPPYTISPKSSQRSSCRYPGSMRVEAHSNSRWELEFQSKMPAVILVHDHSEWLQVDLDDWLSSDQFPSLRSKQKSPAMVFGLPKHSQLSDTDRVERLRHCNLPPVAAVDPNSIAIGNLPIPFSWSSKSRNALSGDDMMQSTEQFVQELQLSLTHKDLQPPPLLHKDTSAGARSLVKNTDKSRELGKKAKLTEAKYRKSVSGPVQPSPSIEDLFSHSYSPPSGNKATLISLGLGSRG